MEIFYTADTADRKQQYINHAEMATYRVLMAMLSMLVISNDATDFVIRLALYLSLYWIVFDIGLNLFRGKPWNYLPIGSSPREALLDRIWKENWVMQYVIKFLILTICLFFFLFRW